MTVGRSQAAEFPPAPPGTFSIAVIPDTQLFYGRGTKMDPESDEPLSNPAFTAYVDWIANNLSRQRIAFVSHVGDVVGKNRRVEWEFARRLMDRLHGRVPYGISLGNNDMKRSGDSSLFQEYFPAARFKSFDWYGGCFEGLQGNAAISGNNANSFQLITAAGVELVVLHLECNAPDDVLDWANDVLTRHADRRAIVTTHMDLGPVEKPETEEGYFFDPKGRMRWTKRHEERGNSPQAMWDKCFRRRGNLFMICCGDQSRTQALRQADRGDHGNVVYSLLSDYGEEGLRVMRFLPAEDRIEVRTYNPLASTFCEQTDIVPERDQHQFVLEYK